MKNLLKTSYIVLLFSSGLSIISLEEGVDYQSSKRQRLEQQEIENVVSIHNFDFDDELFNELLDLDFSEFYQSEFDKDSFIHTNAHDQNTKNKNIAQPVIKNSSALYVSSRRLKNAFSHPSVVALTLDQIEKKPIS